MKNLYAGPIWKAFYAPDDAGGGTSAAPSTENTAGATDTSNESEAPAKKTFDEILADKDYQSEFDRRVAKAIDTRQAKMEEDFRKRLEEQKTEAEKLAKMNAEQKADYQREQREKELAEREANIIRRELKAEALTQLGEAKLPLKLADVLDYSNAEACSNSLKSVTEAFQEAVAEGIAEATKGGKTLTKAPEGSTLFTKAQIDAMSLSEINANWDAVQESMKHF